jgi:hypothetical protein
MGSNFFFSGSIMGFLDNPSAKVSVFYLDARENGVYSITNTHTG